MDTNLAKWTQRGLNAILKCQLKDDGDIGKLSKEQIVIFIQKIKSTYTTQKFIWKDDYNFGAIRTDDVLTNKFTDWAFMIMNNTQLVMVPVSTKPGLLYMQQKTTLGGIIVEGQYDSWIIQSGWWSGLSFCLQDRNISFYRDVDLDNVIDRGTVYQGIAGFNIHSYRTPIKDKLGKFLYWWNWNDEYVSSTTSGILSKGCIVMQEEKHKLFWPYVEQFAKAYKGRTMFALLKGSWI